EDRLEAYESYIEDFTISNKSLDLRQDMNQSIQFMSGIDSQKVVVRREMSYLSSTLENLEKEELSSGGIQTIPNYPELNEALANLQLLIESREILLSSYKENTYAVAKKNQEIAIAKESLRESIALYKERAERELARLNTRQNLLEESFKE